MGVIGTGAEVGAGSPHLPNRARTGRRTPSNGARRQLDRRERAWRDTIALLRVAFPPAYPVVVRRVKFTPKAGQWADTALRTKGRWHFIIRIDRSLTEPARSLVLMHEWAHALAWHPNHRSVEDHGPEWGVAHARIWQGVVES